jgi:hypothetical protein
LVFLFFFFKINRYIPIILIKIGIKEKFILKNNWKNSISELNKLNTSKCAYEYQNVLLNTLKIINIEVNL